MLEFYQAMYDYAYLLFKDGEITTEEFNYWKDKYYEYLKTRTTT